ncbi:MAG: response regulator transcription factor [Paludibacter sp.]
MIKVFIVDDHEIMREGLKRILNDETDMEVVAEAENGTEALKMISEIDCDLILLDLNLPGRSGTELIAEIKKKKPKAQILILSISPEKRFALPALKAGASGYLNKDSALTELVVAIRKVQSKKRYMSMTLAEQLAFESVVEEAPEQRKLTNLENCIMLMLAKGKENKEISKELALSINSVAQNRRKVLEKLHLKNNVQLTHYVIENNLLTT